MNIFNRKPKHNIKAVQEQDLEHYLKSLGVLDSINSGEVLCQFCGNKITLDTIEAIAPKEGRIVFTCSNQKT